MTNWASYFVIKAFWDWRGSLRMSFFWNLAFFAAVLLPQPKARGWRWAWRTVLALAGFLLLWRDSFLPALRDVFHFAGGGAGANLGFTARFLTGALNPAPIVVSALLLAACRWAARKGLRLGPVCLLVLAGLFVRELREPKGEQDKALFRFHESEAARSVTLPQAVRPAFDVVILHVCSLSWDDLEAIGVLDHPILRPLDHVFTGFNSVTSYSTPAALRLSRALCGQVSHEELYRPWPQRCNLWKALRSSGFATYAAMNHSGRSREMLSQLIDLAALDPLIDISTLPVKSLNFDDAPLYSDIQVLERWLDVRKSSPGPAVLYYNTISLHGGVHAAGEPGWWLKDRKNAYHAAIDGLAADFERFYAQLEAAGRPTVVFFVPEHGLALRSSPMQASELRDIPLASITGVPFGIKVFGPKTTVEKQARHEAPISYMALAQLLASFLEKPASTSAGFELPPLPVTEPVFENMGATILKENGRFYLRTTGSSWLMLP